MDICESRKTKLHDMNSFKEQFNPEDIVHYGTKRHSGRYPFGSGEDPYQHEGDFATRVSQLRKEGYKDTEIAKMLLGENASTVDLRAQYSKSLSDQRAYEVKTAKSLREKGYSYARIAEEMGLPNESSVRSILNRDAEVRTNSLRNTADFLKQQVDEKGMIDVGKNIEMDISDELGLGISRTKLDSALKILEDEGYVVQGFRVPQATNPSQWTTMRVLVPKELKESGMTDKEIAKYVFDNQDKIQSIAEYQSLDNGYSFQAPKPPVSMDSERVFIRYREDGGQDKDGVIELRPGVEDISLGKSHYAQVRIAVDGTHYMKGMAMYSQDIPAGYDIVYNTNKKLGTDKYDVFKEMKKNPDGTINQENPFGALIKAGGQETYLDIHGNEKQRVINKLREESDWEDYNKNLSSQFLAKQNITLVKRQLDLSYDTKLAEFEEISNYNNPVVKKKMLESFADDCDSASVHLKAAALPRQSTKVILPITTLPDNEIYAPTYKNGEKVALIRYPHAGPFEIAELTVNNNHKDAKGILGNAIDAVGINLNVANKLSGADFDGDTVIVIPVNNKVRVKSAKTLDELKDFDTKDGYSPAKLIKDSDGNLHAYTAEGREYRLMSKENKQIEMGKVSNLITDMTIRGANNDEIARAVKHSMVVIDSEKHHLDYKQSEIDNDIQSLKNTYQPKMDISKKGGGASTLLSKSKSEARVPERKDWWWSKSNINPETGEKIFTETGRTKKTVSVDPVTGKKTYTDTGEKVLQKSTKMAETKDAFTLSSGSEVEEVYAAYANKLKQLANNARKEYVNTGSLDYSSEASRVYSKEVSSLKAKLNRAMKNAPKERMAQLITNNLVKAKMDENPDLKNDKEDLKKLRAQTLAKARVQTGAHKDRVVFTDREWEAIQSGAIHSTMLRELLNNADMDEVKKMAMPKPSNEMSSAQQARIKSLSNSGYSISEISDIMNCSTSTVSKYMKG